MFSKSWSYTRENVETRWQDAARGGAIVDLVLKDDPEKLSPLWNPVRLARELGQTREAVGSAGHFGLCPPDARRSAFRKVGRGQSGEERRDYRDRFPGALAHRAGDLAGISAFERSALGAWSSVGAVYDRAYFVDSRKNARS